MQDTIITYSITVLLASTFAGLAQKFAKDKPLVFFFPGEYTMYEDTSSNLKLFSILPDDKYYRATNIYEIDEV